MRNHVVLSYTRNYDASKEILNEIIGALSIKILVYKYIIQS